MERAAPEMVWSAMKKMVSNMSAQLNLLAAMAKHGAVVVIAIITGSVPNNFLIGGHFIVPQTLPCSNETDIYLFALI